MGMNHNLGKTDVAAGIDTAAYIGWRRHKQWISYSELREKVWQYAMCHGLADDDKPSVSFLGLVRFAWKRAALARMAKTLSFGAQDQVRYTRHMVAELLHDALDPGWVPVSSSDTTGGGKSTADPATGGTYLVSVMDVRRCLSRLSEFDRSHLICRHYLQVSAATTADQIARSTRTVERHYTSALNTLVKALNGAG